MLDNTDLEGHIHINDHTITLIDHDHIKQFLQNSNV